MANDFEENMKLAEYYKSLERHIPDKVTMKINLGKGEKEKATYWNILYFTLHPPFTFPIGNCAYPISLFLDTYTFKAECESTYARFLDLEEKLNARLA